MTASVTTKGYMKRPKDYGVLVLGILSFIYLLNIGFGILELLPDALPLVGNIDEALAFYLLYSVFTYFGVDVTPFVKRRGNN